MPPWLSVLIAVVVPILAVVANALVNIKIKFAPDADTATRELKDLALRIIQWILNAGVVAVMVREVFSSEPLTRLAVFEIAFQVTVLTLIVAFKRFATLLERAVKSQVRVLKGQEKIDEGLSGDRGDRW